jgi:aspartyl-tRNA(Asn)/glutamyl-tRNA(Gln) amidotransferase subunit C
MSVESKGRAVALDVEYVARLARLELTPEEIATFRPQLDQLLAYFRQLGELDLTGIEPTSHAHPAENVLRDDEPRPGLDTERVLRNAPACIEGQFEVPRIVE